MPTTYPNLIDGRTVESTDRNSDINPSNTGDVIGEFSRASRKDLDDVAAGKGAPNIDSKCTGTSLRDFLKASDFSRIPEDIIALYDDGTETGGDLLYKPSQLNS